MLNKEKQRAKHQLWRERNPDRVQRHNRAYYEKHKDELFEKHLEWKTKNKEHISAYFREYRLSARGRYFQIKANAKNKGVEFLLNKDEFITWYENTDKVCFYCNVSLVRDGDQMKNPSKETLDRIDSSKPYTMDNVVLACRKCNAIKGNWLSTKQMLQIAGFFFGGEDRSLVQLDENQSLPEIPKYTGACSYNSLTACGMTQQDMLDDNWKKTIKEAHNAEKD